jgi:hypothetical protein
MSIRDLNPEQRRVLNTLEAKIGDGLDKIVQQVLSLYQSGGAEELGYYNFADCCQEKFGISRPMAEALSGFCEAVQFADAEAVQSRWSEFLRGMADWVEHRNTEAKP